MQSLEADGIGVDTSGGREGEQIWQLAQFNPPWTIPWLRTNEILVPITQPQPKAGL